MAAYGYAAVAVVAGSLYATVTFAVGVVVLSAYRYVAVTGPERRARLAPLTAAVAFGLVLVAGAIARLVGGAARSVQGLARHRVREPGHTHDPVDESLCARRRHDRG